MENINELLSIAIVGSALSLFVEWYSNKYYTGSKTTRVITIVLSVALGLVVWVLQWFPVLWGAILGVLASASTFYAVILKQLQGK